MIQIQIKPMSRLMMGKAKGKASRKGKEKGTVDQDESESDVDVTALVDEYENEMDCEKEMHCEQMDSETEMNSVRPWRQQEQQPDVDDNHDVDQDDFQGDQWNANWSEQTRAANVKERLQKVKKRLQEKRRLVVPAAVVKRLREVKVKRGGRPQAEPSPQVVLAPPVIKST